MVGASGDELGPYVEGECGCPTGIQQMLVALVDHDDGHVVAFQVAVLVFVFYDGYRLKDEASVELLRQRVLDDGADAFP